MGDHHHHDDDPFIDDRTKQQQRSRVVLRYLHRFFWWIKKKLNFDFHNNKWWTFDIDNRIKAATTTTTKKMRFIHTEFDRINIIDIIFFFWLIHPSIDRVVVMINNHNNIWPWQWWFKIDLDLIVKLLNLIFDFWLCSINTSIYYIHIIRQIKVLFYLHPNDRKKNLNQSNEMNKMSNYQTMSPVCVYGWHSNFFFWIFFPEKFVLGIGHHFSSIVCVCVCIIIVEIVESNKKKKKRKSNESHRIHSGQEFFFPWFQWFQDKNFLFCLTIKESS